MGCASSAGAATNGDGDKVGAPRPREESTPKQNVRVQDIEEHLAAKCLERSLPEDLAGKLTNRRQSRTSDDGGDQDTLPKLNFTCTNSINPSFTATASTTSKASASHFAAADTYNSQTDFALANQTIIIFDWDDTLCPSSCMRRNASFDSRGRLTVRLNEEARMELSMLASQVIPLIEVAKMLGQVVIVTNAKRPWVDISCQNFLPSFKKELDKIPVIYALELVKPAEGGRVEVTNTTLTDSKVMAMKAAVTDFYSRYPNQSWKNMVSIGDALFEHDAIKQVAAERPMFKPCRTKTLKLLEGPTVPGLVVQLSIVEKWLAKIVKLDGDIDIDLSADQETVNGWCTMFG
jgi:hypothetical protein